MCKPIYRMDLNVQATDTNVDAEGGPKVTRNVEPIRLRIVSEGDLLTEISRGRGTRSLLGSTRSGSSEARGGQEEVRVCPQ